MDIKREGSPNSTRTDEFDLSSQHYQSKEARDQNVFNMDTKFYIAMVSLATGIVVVSMNDGLISVASAVLARKLNASALEVFWNGTAYLLCAAVFQPIFVHVSQFFGRKALIIAAMIIYLIGTTLGMTSPNILGVVAARALQGVGTGGIIVMTEVIICDMIPLRSRGLWLGIINGAYALGSAFGPILGGFIVEKTEWQWLFYVDLPFLIVALVTTSLFFRDKTSADRRALITKLQSIDWIGMSLFIPAISIFIAPLTFGGVLFPWSSWQTLGSLALGSIGLVLFAIYEKFRCQDKLIDSRIFKSYSIIITYIATVIFYIVYGSQLYYIPLWLQAVRGFSPMTSGFAFLPFSGVSDVTAIVVGVLITAIARYRWANWAGLISLAIGLGLLALPSAQLELARWIIPMIVAGLGVGTLITSLRLTLQAAVSDKETANAVAIFSLFRDLGDTLGVALGGSVFQNSLKYNLEKAAASVFTIEQATNISRNAASLVPLNKSFPDAKQHELVVGAYSVGFRTTALVMCCFTIFTLILSFFIKSYNLNRETGEPELREATMIFLEPRLATSILRVAGVREIEIANPSLAVARMKSVHVVSMKAVHEHSFSISDV